MSLSETSVEHLTIAIAAGLYIGTHVPSAFKGSLGAVSAPTRLLCFAIRAGSRSDPGFRGLPEGCTCSSILFEMHRQARGATY
jgi:hypothetical protein